MMPLIKDYLRLGAYAGAGAVVDRQFGTTAFLSSYRSRPLTLAISRIRRAGRSSTAHRIEARAEGAIEANRHRRIGKLIDENIFISGGIDGSMAGCQLFALAFL